jgi:radical SAM superfamily enzyme YgiQ (UPF0313 family)
MRTNQDSQKIKVGLVQINNSFSNQNYLPLSIGMLQAYAQKHLKQPENYQFLLPLYNRIPVDEGVQRLLGVDVALFSTYVWNFRISLEIARKLKSESPETVIVFGGPHVPDRVEGFLRKYPFIDLACHGEGEQPALSILESCLSRSWDRVPSISFLAEDGRLVQNPKAPRMQDLSLDPSPYLEGVFAPLMEANPEEHWIALWETNRGCPFACTFCDWGSAIQSKVYSFDLERVYNEVEWFAEHKIEYVFCCDANFGILPRDIDIANYVAQAKKKRGYPGAFSVQNTKNATERAYKVQKTLADAGLNRGVDIALQSTDKNTLQSIKRANISLETYQELQRRFTRDGVETYTDMILGLPGETYESFANGVSTIIENGQHNRIQFNNLSILPNAEMGDPEYQKRYGMLTVESKTINIHGRLAEPEEEIYETQVLVIGTNTMPKEDWARTRVFSWMAALLHFDKILQIPLILVHDICSVSYRELIEAFSEGSLDSFPTLARVKSFLGEQARNIQNGGPEYTRGEEWLNIWWTADEYILIELVVENKLQQFYVEAEQLLNRLLDDRFLSLAPDLLHEAIELNRNLIKLPFQTEHLDLDLSHNIWEFYQSSLSGRTTVLEKRSSKYHIDRTTHSWSSWDEWFQEVVWYGNKKGAYLYGNDNVETQLAGHY